MLRKQLLDTTRGRIVALLQRGSLTADDVAAQLGLTASAVRAQITAMERDGVVQRSGLRAGNTRPSNVFELTPEVERLLSPAYLPLLYALVQAIAEEIPHEQMDTLLRETGKRLVEGVAPAGPLRGSLRERVHAASALMNDRLGAITHVEENGHFTIRGVSCPLAALTATQPPACLVVEGLLTGVVGAPVRECCDRDQRPRCRFVVDREPV